MGRGLHRLALLLLLWIAPISSAAATIERFVMPGEVAADHADIEMECSKCHSVLERGAQTRLCLDCHHEIDRDVQSGSGFHGRAPAVEGFACSTCHDEHKGRQADLAGLSEALFQHDLTDFPLSGAHRDLDCSQCHSPGEAHRDTVNECAVCHRDDEPHRGALGGDCAECHFEDVWNATSFDHATTGYELTGTHAVLECGLCHLDERYAPTSSECVGCHLLSDIHEGERGRGCEACHSAQTWKKETFDHRAETGFALDSRHQALACSSCHLEQMTVVNPPKACIGCHSVDDVHAGRNGDDCGTCHAGIPWGDIDFNHGRRTGFELEGSHAKVVCDKCHIGMLSDFVPSTCEGCHDDPHGEEQSAECEDCHAESGWYTVRFDHDLVAFPLIGLHRVLACADCHASVAFREVPQACVDCHLDNDYHMGAMGEACTRCHSPNGWERWDFDHGLQTAFELRGAHADAPCSDCHPSDSGNRTLSQECVSCHERDDRHEGRYGRECGRCHTTRSFDDARRYREKDRG